MYNGSVQDWQNKDLLQVVQGKDCIISDLMPGHPYTRMLSRLPLESNGMRLEFKQTGCRVPSNPYRLYTSLNRNRNAHSYSIYTCMHI